MSYVILLLFPHTMTYTVANYCGIVKQFNDASKAIFEQHHCGITNTETYGTKQNEYLRTLQNTRVVDMKDASCAKQLNEEQTSTCQPKATSMQHDGCGVETSVPGKQWGHAIRTFCETTTFHGLRNVTEPRSNRSRR